MAVPKNYCGEIVKLDPVLAEIRATREAFSERFGGDVSAMLADLRKREAESGRTLVWLPPKRLQLEKTMQIPVLVEPAGPGRFRATGPRPFTSVAEGCSREEVIANICLELAKEVEAGKSIVMVEVSEARRAGSE